MQVLLYAINAALVEPQLRFERDTIESQLSELGYSLGEKIWHKSYENHDDLPDINPETEESDLIEFIVPYEYANGKYSSQEHYIGTYSQVYGAFLDRDGDEWNPEDCVWRYVKDYNFE